MPRFSNCFGHFPGVKPTFGKSGKKFFGRTSHPPLCTLQGGGGGLGLEDQGPFLALRTPYQMGAGSEWVGGALRIAPTPLWGYAMSG